MWQFGHYRMEELIARGGMGEVHRAYDTQHDRVVAVKLLSDHLAGDDDFQRRFRREARAAARLREPHVIPIHAYGEIDGRLYLDMRLVEGKDLSTVLTERGPMTPAAAVDVIGQVAAALDAAHTEGLVHRDVKPSNVLLDASGFAYLVDFGIARSMASNAEITSTGIPIGTVAYMAPERFALEGRVDHRADVYSLACLLYQCLVGRRPFPDENPLALIQAHLSQEPPKPSAQRSELSPAFDQIIATGMAKRPEDRFESAGALASAAKRALEQSPIQPATHQLPPRPATQRLPPHAATQLPTPRPATLPIPDLRPMPNRQPPPKRSRRGWLVGAGIVLVTALASAAALIWLPELRDGSAGEPTTSNTRPPSTEPSEPAGPDLSVSVPISTPPCDGEYIVIVGSAVDSTKYQREVQQFLDANPGTSYLHAPSTGCQSLRHQLEGADIYSVYYGTFPDKESACGKRAEVGGDSFVRRLDDTSTPERAVSCG